MRQFPVRSLRHLLLPLLILLGACAPPADPEPPAPAPAPAPEAAPEAAALAAIAEEHITAERVFGDIAFLASDEMRGRDTPSPELEEAAEFLADRFRELGLEPAGDEGSFVQRWPFGQLILDGERSHAGAAVNGEERSWRYAREYFALPGPEQVVEGAPVYVPSPAAAMEGLPSAARGAPVLVSLPDGLGPDFGMVLQAAMQVGAAGVVLIMDEETAESDIFQIAGAVEGGGIQQMPFPVLGISLEVGEELLHRAGVEPRGARDPPEVLENVTLSYRTVFDEETHQVPNVVALLPGSDPDLSGTYVVLTAHFDHVGVGPSDETGDSIYSGADDNASGTTALLKVASAFAALPEAPARSVVFLAVSGEEKGLLGSQYYVDFPTVPAEGIVANLNMDMVSRNHPDTVYVIGEEFSTLGNLAREVASEHPELGLVPAPDPEPEEQAFLRSDHYSFVQAGIPAVMLTTWLHDDYHLPSDTPDRVDPDKAARVARFGFLLAHRIASDPEPPAWTEEGRELLRTLGIQVPEPAGAPR